MSERRRHRRRGSGRCDAGAGARRRRSRRGQSRRACAQHLGVRRPFAGPVARRATDFRSPRRLERCRGYRGAVTAITAIDVSQRGGFGAARAGCARARRARARLRRVSYRALQAALDAGLARAGLPVDHGVTVTQRSTRRRRTRARGERRGAALRMDGATGRRRRWRRRHRRRRCPTATRLRAGRAGREGLARPSRTTGVAYERFTPRRPDGAAAGRRSLRAGMDDDAGAGAERLRRCAERRVPRRARDASSARASAAFCKCEDRRTFPLALEFAGTVVGARACSRATRRRRCIRLPARVSIWVCAMRTSWRRRADDAARCDSARRSARALTPRRRPSTAARGIAFTHGLRRACSATTRRCCAGRAGWRSLLLDCAAAAEASVHARDAVRLH